MSENIQLEGKTYLPAARAAKHVGVTRDYIGRLCREGKITARRIGSAWYVEAASLDELQVAQQYAKAKRSQELSAKRLVEYRARQGEQSASATAGHISAPAKFGSVRISSNVLAPVVAAIVPEPIIIAQQNAAETMRAAGRKVGASAATRAFLEHAPRALYPTVQAVAQSSGLMHRLFALAFAFALTFGAYGFVDAEYRTVAIETAQEGAMALAGAPEYFSHVAIGVKQNADGLFALTPSRDDMLASTAGIATVVASSGSSLHDALSNVISALRASAWSFAFFPRNASTNANVVAEIVGSNATTSLPRIASNATTVINNPIVERIREIQTNTQTAVSGVSVALLTDSLQQLDNKLSSRIYALSASGHDTYQAVAQTNRIDQLNGTTLNNVTINGVSGLKAGDIPALSYFPATSTISVAFGGTGTSTIPSYGKLLVGNALGGYDLLATSSLGIVGGGGGTWGSITGTLSDQTDLQNALNAKLSTAAWYATTTDGLAQGTTNKYWSDALFDTRLSATTTLPNITTLASLSLPYSQLTGVPITSSYPFALTGNATSTLTQFNGGLTAYASTTIGSGTQAGGLTISGGATTTGNAYIAGNVGVGTVAPGSKLSIAGGATIGSGYTALTAPTNGLLVQGNVGIGVTPSQSLDVSGAILIENSSGLMLRDSGSQIYSPATNQLSFYVHNADRVRIDASGNVGIGTTTPAYKLSVEGSSTLGNQAIAGYYTATTTTASQFLYASTTALTVSGIGYFGTASTTNLIISGVTGGLLKTSSTGVVSLATAGTDYLTSATFFAYPFGVAGNATSTLTQFNGGLTAYASSTIGDSTQTGGLTINGGATTTGNAYIAGNVGVGTVAPGSKLSIAGGAAIGSGYTASAAPTNGLLVQGNVGIGNTNPGAPLDVNGSALVRNILSVDDTLVKAYSSFGSNSTTHALSNGADLLISGNLEVDQNIYADGSTISFSQASTTNNLQVGGVVLLSDGSAASPAFTFTNDSDTGIYRPGTNTLGFVTAGSERARFDQTGNLGIGTTSPFTKLSIGGDTYIGGNLTATGTVAFTGLSSGLLKSTNGTLSIATAGTDYLTAATTFAYPFGVAGNATSTLTQFNGGLTAYASSTIGDGSTTGGLTVSGTATTTGRQVVGGTFAVTGTSALTGNVTVGGTNAGGTLSVTGTTQLELFRDASDHVTFAVDASGNMTVTNSGSGITTFGSALTTNGILKTTNSFQQTGSGNSYFTGNLGIGSTTPWGLLSVNPNVLATGVPAFVVGSSTKTSFIVTANNNSGFGTTTPWGKLSVDTTFVDAGTPSFVVGSSSRTDLLVTQAGNVGIGTLNPAALLTVNGLASTTNLTISGVTGGLLKTSASGVVSIATAGTDYLTGADLLAAYPFSLTGNATSSLTQFNGGLTAYATSTIGSGTQAGGLTISGGATTTGNAYVAGKITVGGSGDSYFNGTGDVYIGSGAVLTNGLGGTPDLSVAGYVNVGGGINATGDVNFGSATQWSGLGGSADLSVAGYINANTGIVVAGGSASTPGLQLNSSGNSGIFETGSNATGGIGFSTQGNERARFDQTGNFGIASTSPWGRLSVDTSSLAAGVPSFVIGSSSRTDLLVTQAGNVGIGTTSPVATLGLQGSIGVNSSQLYLAANGRVGVGTSGPNGVLTVAQNNRSIGLRIENPQAGNYVSMIQFSDMVAHGNYIAMASSTGDLLLGGNSINSANAPVGQVLIQLATGNLGVGTTSPSQALSVQGNGLFSGNLSGANLTATGTVAFTGLGSGLVKSTNGTLSIDSNTYSTFGYPFALTGNATSTLTQFNGGLTAYATTTIGDGTQAGGLTISGGATTTGNAYIAGNVGIGTKAPQNALEISGGSSGSAVTLLRLTNPNTGNSTEADIDFQLSSTNALTQARIGAIRTNNPNAGDSDLAFSTRLSGTLTERMRVTNTGNVGIGTTSPWGKLSINNWTSDTAGQPLFVVASSTATATSTAFIITNGGNVGIGTSSPAATLDIGGKVGTFSVLGSAKLAISDDYNGIAGVQMTNVNSGTSADFRFLITDPTGHYFAFAQPGTGNTSTLFGQTRSAIDTIFNNAGTARTLAIGTVNSADMLLGTNNAERVRITSDGNVGIGTTTPFAALQIATTTGKNLVLTDSGAGANLKHWLLTSAAGNFSIGTTSDAYATSTPPAFTITNAGNVGIGTSTPSRPLTIVGTGAGSELVAFAASTSVQKWHINMLAGTGGGANLNFSESGVKDGRLFLQAGGNVGIGTTSPWGLLSVNPNVLATGAPAFVVGSSTKTSFIVTANNNSGFGTTTPWGKLSVDTSLVDAGTPSFVVGSSSRTSLIVTQAGNVGIGTVNPTAQFQVDSATADSQVYVSNTAPRIALGNNSTYASRTSGLRIAMATAAGNFMTGSGQGDSFIFTEGPNSGTAGNLYFQSGFSGSGVLTPQVVLKTSGNFGIGTTTPLAQLEVGSGTTASGSTVAMFGAASSGGAVNALSLVNSAANAVGNEADLNFHLANNYTPTGKIGAVLTGSTDSDLIFATYHVGLSEKMRITAAGNVGIATTSPFAALSVQNKYGTTNNSIFAVASSTASNGSTATTFFNVDSTGLTTIGDPTGTGDASTQFAADTDAWNIGYYSSDKSFRIASSTNLANNVALSIAKTGTASFGGSVIPSSTNTYNLGQSGTNWGCLYYNGGTTGTCASDERLKTAITPLSFDLSSSTALEQIAGITVNSFAYRTATSTIYHGLIAQQVLAVAPELVTTDPSTGMYEVKYGDVQWLTLQAVQQLNSNVESLASTSAFSAAEAGLSLGTATSTATSTPVVVQTFATRFFGSLITSMANWFATASNGIGDFFASKIHTKQLCVTKSDGTDVCVTGDQLAAAIAGQTAAAATNTTGHAAPTITVEGANPAQIPLNAAYSDLGVIAQDYHGNDLTVHYTVNGATTTAISLDTSTSTTYTIGYFVTDNDGLTATASRTVTVGGATTSTTSVTDSSTGSPVTTSTTTAATSTSTTDTTTASSTPTVATSTPTTNASSTPQQ